MNRPLGHRSCRSSEPPARLPMNHKPPGPNGSPVNRQVSAGSEVNRQVRPGYPSGRFTPRGISPTLAPKFSLDLSMVNLCCKINTRTNFGRLCSGLRILVDRHLIILKSLSFSPSSKSGSITSLILKLLTLVSHRKILWRIIHLSRLPKHRFKKY